LLTRKIKSLKEPKRRGSQPMGSSDSKRDHAEELFQDEKGSTSVPVEKEGKLSMMQMVVGVQRMEETHV
jgi:hypothetical protein